LIIREVKRSINFWIEIQSHPHPPKSKNPPTNHIHSIDKKHKNSIFTPENDRPITNPQSSSTSTNSKQQRMQGSFQHIFPPIPTKRHGANRFKTQPSRMCTQSMVGNFGKKLPNTSDPIQLSSSPSDHKNSYENLNEISTGASKPIVEIDYEHVMPNLLQESIFTLSHKTLIPSTKCDIPSP